MLDWFKEEKIYVEKAVDSYIKEQNKMPLGFMISKKTLRKNIEKVKKRATDKYRFDKLMRYREEIETERKRIDEVIEKINKKFNDYLKSIEGNVNANVKPFKLEANEYEFNYSITADIEIVKIKCEPFQIAFLQEIIGDDKEC